MRFIFLIFMGFITSGFSQTSDTLLHQVTFLDHNTKLPIPFLTVNKNTTCLINGTCEIPFQRTTINHPEYGAKVLEINKDTVLLDKINYSEKLFWTNRNSSLFINTVLKHRKKNTPETFAPFKYNSYNKFYIYTDKTEDTKSLINRLLTPFSVTLKEYKKDHHIILSESYTERTFKSPLREEEIVKASKISGIDHPLLLSLNSQVQTFSFYNDYIRIGTKDHVGPLTHGSLNRYHYKIIDTIPRTSDSLITIQFYPKQYKYFESLKGFLYINTRDYALEHCIIYSAKDHQNNIQITHTSHKLNEGYFPYKTISSLAIKDIGKNNAQFTIIAESTIENIKPKTQVKSNYSDIAVYYEKHSFKDSTNWALLRPYPLNSKEKNTYSFYDSIGQINNFTQAINFGEQLYFQKIPLKYYNIDVKHLADYNDYTGPQIGFGASSNDKLSTLYTVSAYSEYGFNDKDSKFGASFKLRPPLKRKLEASFIFSKDIREAGIHPQFFTKNMYNTEWLRLLKLNTFDKVINTEISLSANPFNYFFVSSGIQHEYSIPTHTFNDTQIPNSNFNLTSFNISLKYAYGERYFKLLKERISLGRPFPVIWLQYKTNLNTLGNDYQYKQLYSKAEYKLPFLGYGQLGIQLSAGKTWGDLPYSRLYNSKGSLGVRTVAHNSFETMEYNEFISSDFIFAFISHDFGYFNFLNNKYFKPRVELVYNMGWGRLNDSALISKNDFKTLRRGYFEIGSMINNLLILKINPTKLGLGVGYFHRIGAYRNDSFSNNSFFKLSLTFKL